MEYEAYRDRLTKNSAGGTDEYLYSERVEQGELITIDRIAAEDETTAFTRLRFFIDGKGYQHFLSEQKSPAAGTLYWDPDPVTLRSGERIGVKFTGTTSSDVLVAYLTGERGA